MRIEDLTLKNIDAYIKNLESRIAMINESLQFPDLTKEGEEKLMRLHEQFSNILVSAYKKADELLQLADENKFYELANVVCINDFIKHLQSISEEKRKLPLVIRCPNGEWTTPTIKMLWDDTMDILKKGPDKMVIDWR